MDEIDAVYQRRAERLARRPAAVSSTATVPVLVIGLGAERYGIELADLAEVFPYRGCTPVPGGPPALLGVINVRGDIKPLVDLRKVLGLGVSREMAGCVVMLRDQAGAMGFLVDRADGVRQIDPSAVRAAADDGAASGSRLIKGVTPDTVMLLDTRAALVKAGVAAAGGTNVRRG